MTTMTDADTAARLIAMERAALDRWCAGDPDGFLEISAPDVAYFDPFQERRIDSLEALRRLYDGLRGQVRTDGYEMIDPRVAASGDMAVLTFQFASHGDGGTMRWNTTEVFRRVDDAWRIVHTHWSLTRPNLAN